MFFFCLTSQHVKHYTEEKKVSFLIWEECSGFPASGIMSGAGLSWEQMCSSAPHSFGAFTVKGSVMTVRFLSWSLELTLTVSFMSLFILNYPAIKYGTNLILAYGLFLCVELFAFYREFLFLCYVGNFICHVSCVINWLWYQGGFSTVYRFVFYFLPNMICRVYLSVRSCVCYPRSLFFPIFPHREHCLPSEELT